MRKTFAKTRVKILFSLLVITLLFIFVNSCLPPSVSSAESEAVSGFIEQLLPQWFPFRNFILNNVRKIAHFIEFGLLGALSSSICVIYLSEKKEDSSNLNGIFCMSIFRQISFGVAVALADETIQIFSSRGPSIIDVWIDSFGYLAFSALVYVAYSLFFVIRRRKLQKQNN